LGASQVDETTGNLTQRRNAATVVVGARRSSAWVRDVVRNALDAKDAKAPRTQRKTSFSLATFATLRSLRSSFPAPRRTVEENGGSTDPQRRGVAALRENSFLSDDR